MILGILIAILGTVGGVLALYGLKWRHVPVEIAPFPYDWKLVAGASIMLIALIIANQTGIC